MLKEEVLHSGAIALEGPALWKVSDEKNILNQVQIIQRYVWKVNTILDY